MLIVHSKQLNGEKVMFKKFKFYNIRYKLIICTTIYGGRCCCLKPKNATKHIDKCYND